MKNSELKTIIRHIDRLTRNLNARGRRRDAADDNQQRETVEFSKGTIKAYSKKMAGKLSVLASVFKDDFPKFADQGDFESVKRYAKSISERDCKQLTSLMNNFISLSDKAIKAQRF